MVSSSRRVLLCSLLALTSALLSTRLCANELDFTRDIDLVYLKQDGYALTMDRVIPARTNGASIVIVLSGRWVSKHEFLAPQVEDQLPQITADSAFNPTVLLERGYTVFFVVHGAAPMFTIPEIHTQLGEALSHIRTHADRYGIDPQRIGMMGASAGGHLTLLRGTSGSNESRPQAMVAYFPPSDFLNYGTDKKFFVDYMEEQVPDDGFNRFTQALELMDHEPEKFLRSKVTDPERLAQHYRDISPYYHVTDDDPPTLLLHGDADQTVPIQQSERIAKQLDAVGVPYRLHINQGGAHGWKPDTEELKMVADWFDTHLN